MSCTKTGAFALFILLFLSASAANAATITVDDDAVDVWDCMCLSRAITGVGVV